jgi:NACalpha-BTF3-like transcription factor
MNFLRKLLSSGSQTAPKVIDDLVAPTKALTKKGALEADEILGGAAKRAGKVDDIMDAEIIQRMDPRLSGLLKGAAATGLIGGGLVGSMMGDEEESVEEPMAREMEAPMEEPPLDELDAGAQDEALNQTGFPLDQEAPPAPVTAPQVEESVEEDVSEEPQMDQISTLQAAQDRDAQDRMMMGLLRAGNQIGGALAMTKPDYSGVEALEKNLGINEKNVKSQIKSKADLQKMEKFNKDFLDEEKLRDPASSASILTRNILSKYGLNIKTAKEARDAGINVQNILLQEITANSRESMMRLKAAEKESKDLSKLDKEKQDNIFKLRKNLTEGNIGKMYANVNGAGRFASLLENFAENPSAFGDFGTLLMGLKALQGDDSVVRGEEMRLGMAATDLESRVRNAVQRVKNGQSLQPKQRADMLNAVKAIRNISSDKYKMMAAPVLEQAREMQIDEKFLLPEYLRDIPQAKEKSTSEFSSKQEMGIQAVMQKNGVSREQAISALRKAGKL